MNLWEILVRPVCPSEEQRYRELMQAYHYLGSLPKIGETLWYVATWRDEWIALLSFSAAALKCAARDRWIGSVPAFAAGAILCGMRGYRAISDWAKSLGTKARGRFGCRYENGRYVVPSEYVIRDVLIRVNPVHLDRALQRWNKVYAEQDESLAIDGKTMCNAIDDHGHQTHVMSVIGHQSKTCYTQKKVGALPVEGDEKVKRTNEIKMAIPLLDAIDIQDKDLTADALLTQRKLADYLVKERKAHYH